jgi:hypothetical protein
MKETHDEIMNSLQAKFGEDWSVIYKLALAQALTVHDYAQVFGLDGPKALALVSTVAKLISANHAHKAMSEIEEFLGNIDKLNLDDE